MAAFRAKDYALAVHSQRRAINILSHEPDEAMTGRLEKYEKARMEARER